MNGISEHNIYIMLLQLSLIFFLCIISGEILKKYKQPTITGDILVGIILGPTILGRIFPEIFRYIFPNNPTQVAMLDTLGWFGLFLVLLSTGIEVDLSSIWKQKGDAIKISTLDVIVPTAVALFFLFLLPEKYLGGENRLITNIFVSVIMTISALPISIRILRDMGVLKSDLGFLIVSALTINDIIGWIIFTILLSVFSLKIFDYKAVFQITAYTGLFTILALTTGKNLINKIFKFVNSRKDEGVELFLVIICFIGILFGLITLVIGIHSLFGFFIAGIIAGDSKELNKRTRNIIHKFVYSIFVSLFFVNIGLKIDFLKNFDLFLALFITVIGVFGRYLGAWTGSKLVKKDKFQRNIIAVAHTPGGEMHIVVSLLALELGLLSSRVFVAIIFGAILSSIIAGPWMSYLIKKSHLEKILKLKVEIYPDIFIEGENREEVVDKMLTWEGFDEYKEFINFNVLSNEDIKCSAFKNMIVVPRGYLKELDESIIIFAKMDKGLHWDSPDGALSKYIFILLTPEENEENQVKLIQKLSIFSENCQKLSDLESLTDSKEIKEFIQDIFK
ncbi:MAG: cation:proton antiporter [Fusobacteriaceae bacterium]